MVAVNNVSSTMAPDVADALMFLTTTNILRMRSDLRLRSRHVYWLRADRGVVCPNVPSGRATASPCKR